MAQEVIHDAKRLSELQALPLWRKIQITQTRIIEWYKHYDGKVIVSFFGGKDSTVLLHLVRQLYPEVPAVFSNTGLEYPEIQAFVRESGTEFVRPKMMFSEVVSKYGYPLISKEVSKRIFEARRYKNKNGELTVARKKIMGIINSESVYFNISKWEPLAHDVDFLINDKCCKVMKKEPLRKYYMGLGLNPYIGILAEESLLRRNQWIINGCNSFDARYPSSKPMSFWTEHDVLEYIVKYNVKIASVYGEIVGVDDDGHPYNPIGLDGEIMKNLKCTGCSRTGCIFCGYGLHSEKGETRFQKLAKTHPRQYEYCIGGGQWADNPDYDPTLPVYDGEWKNWNPKKIWVPSKEGLGMGKVFDMVNEIYGKGFYRYE